VTPTGQLSMPKLELQMPNPDKPELNKIKRQLFGILIFGHCDLFGICDLLFEIFC
jgi:hypothetical protein